MAVFLKLPPGKFARVLQEISGAFQIASRKQKWDPSASGDTAPIRERYQDLVETYQYHNDLVHELPVLVLDPQYELLQKLHWTQPVSTFDTALVNHLTAMISEGFVPHFYTDGSCQYPTLPTARFASFSLVLDLCV